MMAYGDLTPQEQQELQAWLQVVRPIQGAFSRLLNDMAVVKAAHSSHIGAVLVKLSDGDLIPNESGLAGATDVAKSNLTMILGQLNTVLTTYDTDANRELWVKFCGMVNLVRE